MENIWFMIRQLKPTLSDVREFFIHSVMLSLVVSRYRWTSSSTSSGASKSGTFFTSTWNGIHVIVIANYESTWRKKEWDIANSIYLQIRMKKHFGWFVNVEPRQHWNDFRSLQPFLYQPPKVSSQCFMIPHHVFFEYFVRRGETVGEQVLGDLGQDRKLGKKMAKWARTSRYVVRSVTW